MLRRTVLCTLACLTAAAGSRLVLAQPGPVLAGIGSLRLGVSDLQRSLRFYSTLFGSQLREDTATGAVILRLGSSVLELQEAPEAGLLHQSFTITGPDAALQRAQLQAQGIRWQDAADGSVLVRDGDGVLTRLGAVQDWEALQAASVTGVPGKPLFDALLLDETFLSVTNMQVDSMFYARLLDQTSIAVAGSQFFRIGAHARLRLSQAAVGQATGFNYFSVLVTNTDMDAAAEAVFRAGGIVESFLPNGFSFWDPDGLRVVVRGVPQVLNTRT
jgi:catechol 2,3-dioxygenase-like lactoylglutathione lyase family enzyme